MNRTERLYAIAQELRAAAPRSRTAAWLAARFGVSLRTIKRDMRALHEADIGLIADDGRGGGYSLERTVLPPIGFLATEATAVAVAIGAASDLPYREDAHAALAKILGAMSRSQREHAEDLASRLWVRSGLPRGRWAQVMEEGLRNRVVVRLDYLDGDGQRTRGRLVEPMALVRTAAHWQFLAWCRRRESGRWFRSDRIEGAWLTRQRFTDRDLYEVFGAPPSDALPISLTD